MVCSDSPQSKSNLVYGIFIIALASLTVGPRGRKKKSNIAKTKTSLRTKLACGGKLALIISRQQVFPEKTCSIFIYLLYSHVHKYSMSNIKRSDHQ